MPRRTRLVVMIAILIVIFSGPSLLRFYTDWLWFGEVGYQSVFSTMLRAQGTLFLIGFAVTALWLTVNLRVATQAIGDLRPVFTTREGLEVLLPGRRQLQAVVPYIAMAGGLLVGL